MKENYLRLSKELALGNTILKHYPRKLLKSYKREIIFYIPAKV